MGYTQDLLLDKHSVIGLLMPTHSKEINIFKKFINILKYLFLYCVWGRA